MNILRHSLTVCRDILICFSMLALWVWLGYRYEQAQDVTMTACSVVTVPQEVEL